MKIIFDSEEEKLNYFAGHCADTQGFIHVDDCPTHIDCIKCWENSSLKYEIKGDDDILNELWEMVRDIITDVSLGGMSANELEDAFNISNYNHVFDKYTPEEALAKYRAWKNKSKLSVGDVVHLDDTPDEYGVVTRVDSTDLFVLWLDGSSTSHCPGDHELHKHPKGYKKPNITNIFDELKELGWERRD